MAFFLAIAAANWHAKKEHAQQAAAAQHAAEHRRAAYQAAAAQAMAVLRQRGQRLAPRVRQRHAALLQQVLPELAERIRAEAGWAALAATLDDVRKAGHDPAVLLADAFRRRELDTADSISDVLVWRLRRSAHLLALPASPDATATMGTRRTASPAPVTQPATNAVNDPSRRR
ncbi:hypothetical protein SUDANB32_02859 [Streptomyces sp. enrichment culture]|uniref:relaxase n=1 Tax=Streptomyces sp. enrichment culture TaxID=1795815 RepID=UPI003F547AB6